jgi:hypothetical protein
MKIMQRQRLSLVVLTLTLTCLGLKRWVLIPGGEIVAKVRNLFIHSFIYSLFSFTFLLFSFTYLLFISCLLFTFTPTGSGQVFVERVTILGFAFFKLKQQSKVLLLWKVLSSSLFSTSFQNKTKLKWDSQVNEKLLMWTWLR